MTNIKVARNLELPIEAAVQTWGFFGRKGSGKTYAAGKLAESFLDAGIQIVVLDWVGNWYALRLNSTGKGASPFNIPIIGGRHGDIPLDIHGGQLVAEFIVRTGSSAVLDISQFRKNQRRQFVTDFSESFFQAKKERRSPVHLFLEEAQIYAPQRIQDAREFGAIEDIVRLGRNYGIGCSLISQRPQSVNTEMRNQCEPLVVFQLIAKHERKAIGEWMEHMGVDSALAKLSTLENGDCFFWSPAWMKRFDRTRFLKKRTFDASATPDMDSESFEPTELSPADLDALNDAMAQSIEQAQENDPKHLKKRIAALEKELSEAARRTPDADELEPHIERAVQQIKAELLDRELAIQGEIIRQREYGTSIFESVQQIHEFVMRTAEMFGPPPEIPEELETVTMPKTFAQEHSARLARIANKPSTNGVAQSSKKSRRSPRDAVANSDLPKGEGIILAAVINHMPRGCDRAQLTVLTGYKRSSRDAYIARLKEKGLVEQRGDLVICTPDGERALPDVDPLPTGEALRDFWMDKLPAGEAAVLGVLINAYPTSVHRDRISEQTEYKRSSRDAYLARLKARQLIEVDGPGTVIASENLF